MVLAIPVFLQPRYYSNLSLAKLIFIVCILPYSLCRYGCDEFTKDYYRKHYGVTDFEPIMVDTPTGRGPESVPRVCSLIMLRGCGIVLL